MRQVEAKIQASIVDFIRTVAPQLLVFHPANGGLRSASEAVRLRSMGVTAGVPDLVIVEPGGQCRFVEIKSKGGTLSAAQKAIRDRLHSMSVSCITVQSIDEVRLALRAWNIPTKEAA